MRRRTGKMGIILIVFSVLAAVIFSLFLPLSATAAELSDNSLSSDSLSSRHVSAALSTSSESSRRHGSASSGTADSSRGNSVVIFVSREGSCISTDAIELRPGYSTAPAQPGCGPEKGVFLGWSSHRGATQPDFPGGYVFTTTPSSRSFYAVWKVMPETHTLLLNPNGGTQRASSVTVTAPRFLTLLPDEFVREGYRFLGWNTAADGTGISFRGGASIFVLRDVSLYAQWEKISVIPSPDADTDSSSEETTEKTDGKKDSGDTESADAAHEDEQKKTQGAKETKETDGKTQKEESPEQAIPEPSVTPSQESKSPSLDTDGKNPVADTVQHLLFGNSRWKGTAVFPNVVFTIPSTAEGDTVQEEDSESAAEESDGANDSDVGSEPDASQDQRIKDPWTKDSQTKKPRTVDPPFSDMSVEPDSLEEGEDVSQSAFARHAGPLLGAAAVLFVGVAAAFFPLSAGASGGAKISLVKKLFHVFHRL